MNDSAQDLEQLIHQYTQELLRFQKHYAAHMPAQETAETTVASVQPEEAPDAPVSAPVASEPVMAEAEAAPVMTEPVEEAPEEEPVIPEGETDGAGDRPLILPDNDGRYPRSPAPAEEPLPADTALEEAARAAEPTEPSEREPEDNPSANRDLLSDPDAATPQAFPIPPVSTPAMTDFGRLQVQVFKAGEALPIENAIVTIFSEEPDGSRTPFTVTRTNRSGFTPAITVPTVSASLSLEPGHEHPYATYVVQVIAPGYFTVEDVHVPVYGGITSVQPAEMLPLPENYQGDTTVTYPESEPDL